MKRFISLFLWLQILCLGKASAEGLKQLTNLPTVYINTTNKTSVTSKKDFIMATWKSVDGDKTEILTGLRIRCRGNSTYSSAGATKKAYRLKFTKKVALLGEEGASAQNWVLMANHFDKTLMRNALTSCVMARFVGMPFCPGARFIDLVLNDTYVGTYQITDHPDATEGRLDVDTPAELQEGEEPSEGFFLESDGWEDHKIVTTSRKMVPIRIHKPKDGEITAKQEAYVKTWIDRFETALYSSDFRDPDKGYRSLVDSVSLANLYICTELCANIDGFFSTYLYKKANDQRLYFGPLWDYDIAYGNDTRKGDTSQMLMVNDAYGAARVWFVRMWRDPWFRQLILNRWNELKEKGIEQHLLAAVDSMANVLQESQAKNFELYGISTRVYNERVLHSTYQEYVDDLKNFISVHTAYLDNEFQTRANSEITDVTDFQLIPNYYYRIKSAGVGTHFDVQDEALSSGSKACLWSLDESRRTQQWSIRRVGEYYQILNRASGLALNESSETLKTQLDLVEPNETSDAQLWQIVLADEDNDYFNIINKAHVRTANVSDGLSDNGTPLIAWESNEKNQTSRNRQWFLMPDEINSDSIILQGDIVIMLTDSIAAYRERIAKETPGTEMGQVTKSSIDALLAIIAEAEGVINAGKLNMNLAHTYVYYMQRAWQAVEKSRITVDYTAEGNYRLFWTETGKTVTTSSPDIEKNDDSPWGYYAYNNDAGTYERFTTYDNKGKCGSAAERGNAWYRANEYCFVSSTGHFHPCSTGVDIQYSSPAIVFTAPEDGIYFATITVRRNVANTDNALYLRSRYLPQGVMQCPKEDFLFAQAYGTPSVDGGNGQVPQTLDFFIRLPKGDRFTLETEAYTSGTDASGRTIITDLSVTRGHTADLPYTEEEAQAFPRYFDALYDGIESIKSDKATIHKDPHLYDLQGRRITNATTKGIYIRDGKKVVVK